MHEISIVLGIIDLAEKEARAAGVNYIQEIELEIGKLSSIEPEAFEFAWKQGIKNTMLQYAHCHILYREASAQCLECQHDFAIEHYYDPCPTCGSFSNEILTGQEMVVKSITVSNGAESENHPDQLLKPPLYPPIQN